jgi:hypothetical protein
VQTRTFERRGLRRSDAFGIDLDVERTHARELESGTRRERVDLADLREIDAAPERIRFAPFFEREHHRFRHTRERGAARQTEVELQARLSHAREARCARHAHVAALGHEHVGPLDRDAPPDIVREREFAYHGTRSQIFGFDQLLRARRRREHDTGRAHRFAHVRRRGELARDAIA